MSNKRAKEKVDFNRAKIKEETRKLAKDYLDR